MIVPPNGSSGVQFGLSQSPAIDFLACAEDPNKAPEPHGDAGAGESGFNEELLLHDLSSIEGNANNQTFSLGGGIVWNAFANQLSVDGNPAFASDGHAIEPMSYPRVDGGQELRVVEPIFGKAFEANQIVNGTFENEGAVSLTNFELGGDFSSPGSQGAVADLDVLDLYKVPFFSLQPLPEGIAQGVNLVHVPVLVPASKLNQGENRDAHQSLQGNTSTNILETLSVDPGSVKRTADMLNRLSMVSLQIEDLPSTYLAVTRFVRDELGNVVSSIVTIDQDAAGHGWFVDPTPWASEEFVLDSSKVNRFGRFTPLTCSLS